MPNFKDSDLTELHFRLTYYDESDLREVIADLVEDLQAARADTRTVYDDMCRVVDELHTEIDWWTKRCRAWKNRAKNWRWYIHHYIPVEKWEGPEDPGWRWGIFARGEDTCQH